MHLGLVAALQADQPDGQRGIQQEGFNLFKPGELDLLHDRAREGALEEQLGHAFGDSHVAHYIIHSDRLADVQAYELHAALRPPVHDL